MRLRAIDAEATASHVTRAAPPSFRPGWGQTPVPGGALSGGGSLELCPCCSPQGGTTGGFWGAGLDWVFLGARRRLRGSLGRGSIRVLLCMLFCKYLLGTLIYSKNIFHNVSESCDESLWRGHAPVGLCPAATCSEWSGPRSPSSVPLARTVCSSAPDRLPHTPPGSVPGVKGCDDALDWRPRPADWVPFLAYKRGPVYLIPWPHSGCPRAGVPGPHLRGSPSGNAGPQCGSGRAPPPPFSHGGGWAACQDKVRARL